MCHSKENPHDSSTELPVGIEPLGDIASKALAQVLERCLGHVPGEFRGECMAEINRRFMAQTNGFYLMTARELILLCWDMLRNTVNLEEGRSEPEVDRLNLELSTCEDCKKIDRDTTVLCGACLVLRKGDK